MKFEDRLSKLSSYEIIESRTIKDLDSDSYILRHKKTGARVVLMANDDENKVFYIGFRTPPTDSTGVAHIIEHSVLCGSDKYPVKDPFIELAKGSLNTFLNAMTYPDKTVYPVASCNDQDFQNLVDVYLDAVFHPNIYNEKKIFMQEGWHYELQSAEDELKINGVVYNEMKGAFSSPDDVVERAMFNNLFPDTSYGVESGGDPDVIPELTYENFLDFHGRYYHPSNSYIYLYGNCDMVEKLEYIDREYLGKYDALEIDSSIASQKPFDKPRYIETKYSIAENESTTEHTYLAYSIALENNLDPDQYIAFDALDYAICSAPGAPLKKALIDAGIGKDVYSEYDNGLKQPYFSIIAKDTDPEKREEFVSIIEKILLEQANVSLDHISILAALNSSEFRYREADFGSYPRGLMIGLQMLDSWLYDDGKPFIHVEANNTYAKLKSYLDTGYYENLIRDKLINNTHKLILTVTPEKGLTTKKDSELAAKLKEYKDSLSEDEINQLVETTKALAEYQETEDDEETLKCIPLLSRADLKREITGYINDVRKIDEVDALYHNIFTNGIGYIRLIFDMKNIPEDYWGYVGLVKSFIGLMDTENYNYGDFYNEINLKTGGITPLTNAYVNYENPDEFKFTFEIKARVLEENMSDAMRLISEMILNTDYSDKGRMKELIDETHSHIQSGMTAAGHQLAASEAAGSFSAIDATVNATSGIKYLRLIEDLSENFDDKADEVIARIKEVIALIFRPENLMVDFTGSEAGYDKLAVLVTPLYKALNTEPISKSGSHVKPSGINMGYTSAAQVQYVARAGDYRKKGLKYDGSLRVLKVMMGYDYLWNQVRVRGGAYGCMCSFTRNGKSHFVSYRDPNLDRTVEVYEKASEYVRSFEADERTMTQYVIGAISDLDVPMTPARRGLYSLNGYMSNISEETLQKERTELLDTTPEKIRSLAAYIDAFMETGAYCVVGGEDKIKESADSFDKIEPLFS